LLEKGNEIFCRMFKMMDSSPLKTQKQIMISLQQASVICDFLGWRKHPGSAELNVKEVTTRQLLQNWSKGFDHLPKDLLGSELIAAHRSIYVNVCNTIIKLYSSDF